MRNGAGEGQRNRLQNQALGLLRGGIVGALLALGMGGPAAAGDEPRAVHPDIEWFAVAMAELDAAERKATGDLIFASGAESAAPPNPCATVQQPTVFCPCPPQPPWAICY